MDDLRKRIIELETELFNLRAEVERALEQNFELEHTKSAILTMMEELQDSRTVIERAKSELENTFDSLPNPIFIHDEKSKIMRANTAYIEIAGMPFDQIIGKPYYEIFPKTKASCEMCLKILETKEKVKAEEISVPSLGKVFKDTSYPIKDKHDRYLYSIHVLEDITDYKKEVEKTISQEKEITRSLLMIAEATTCATDIEKFMERVVQCVQKIMGSTLCLSYLWDSDTRIFRPSQSVGLSQPMVPSFRTETLDDTIDFIKRIREEKKPIIMYDSGFYQWIKDIRVMAIIPMIGRASYLGLIIVIYKDPRLITERDEKIMEGISHQVSIVLGEVKHYKESIRKTMELSYAMETIQVLHKIDKSIRSSVELQEILETATHMISKIISCERVTIILVDKEMNRLRYAAGFGIPFLSKETGISFSDTDITEVIKTGAHQYVADMTKVERSRPFEVKLIEEGFRSHIRVPLVVSGAIVGVLSIGAKRPAAFTPADLSTVENIATRMAVAIKNAKLFFDMEELFRLTIKSFFSMINSGSGWLAEHANRVARYALDIGKEMGLSEKELKDLELGGFLHDIGNIGTSEALLDKPGKLTDEELITIRQHPLKGEKILEPIKHLKEAVQAVKYHHEFYNGTGYPEGLKGEAIPLFARILSVADAVDAMGMDRPYRKRRSADDIVTELKRCSRIQFDPKVVDTFLKMYPSESYYG
ncbi:MAG: HD domain-containing phosphohydrolase [Candidatus Jettenia sp. CY-1]|nr:MAG: HD domain-containing phosphohydrolase [Candidatus Jettenia sp. CY-1]